GEVVDPHEDHWLALLRRQRSERADDATDGDDLAVAPPLELGERQVDLPPQLVADGRQRMLRDVEAEGLLLEREQLGLVELAGRDRRMVARPLGRALVQVED